MWHGGPCCSELWLPDQPSVPPAEGRGQHAAGARLRRSLSKGLFSRVFEFHILFIPLCKMLEIFS